MQKEGCLWVRQLMHKIRPPPGPPIRRPPMVEPQQVAQTPAGSPMERRGAQMDVRTPQIVEFYEVGLRAFTRRHVRKSDYVLEGGCEKGGVLPWLSPHVKGVVGIDVAKDKLKESEELIVRHGIANALVMHGDVFDLRKELRGRFDVACVFSDMPGGIPGHEAELLHSMSMGLREDGRLLVSLFGPQSVPVRWKYYSALGLKGLTCDDEGTFRDGHQIPPFHSPSFTESRVRQIVRDSLLRILEMEKTDMGWYLALGRP